MKFETILDACLMSHHKMYRIMQITFWNNHEWQMQGRKEFERRSRQSKAFRHRLLRIGEMEHVWHMAVIEKNYEISEMRAALKDAREGR